MRGVMGCAGREGVVAVSGGVAAGETGWTDADIICNN